MYKCIDDFNFDIWFVIKRNNNSYNITIPAIKKQTGGFFLSDNFSNASRKHDDERNKKDKRSEMREGILTHQK